MDRDDGLVLGVSGVNVNVFGIGGETPLTAACANGRSNILSLLLGAEGIDVNLSLMKLSGRTPLFTASLHGKAKIVKINKYDLLFYSFCIGSSFEKLSYFLIQ